MFIVSPHLVSARPFPAARQVSRENVNRHAINEPTPAQRGGIDGFNMV
jgi:hypothetical protein